MSFISVLLALLLEQAKPLARGNPVHLLVQSWVGWCSRNLDGGKGSTNWLTLGVALFIPTFLTMIGFQMAGSLGGWFLMLVWSVAVLYLCLGFRQFSFHFSQIREAMMLGKLDEAWQKFARWQRLDDKPTSEQDLVGKLIEASTLAAHRHVFGVLTWFAIGAALGLGPSGAVFYRVAEMIGRYWSFGPAQAGEHLVCESLGVATREMWHWVDWLPARATAVGFAVVGNFEDALEGWRAWLKTASENHDGLILAAAGGALGLALPSLDTPAEDSEAASSFQTPQLESLSAVVGLVWRTVVVWMVLVALLTLARLLG